VEVWWWLEFVSESLMANKVSSGLSRASDFRGMLMGRWPMGGRELQWLVGEMASGVEFPPVAVAQCCVGPWTFRGSLEDSRKNIDEVVINSLLYTLAVNLHSSHCRQLE
jgi:hypothetical protein